MIHTLVTQVHSQPVGEMLHMPNTLGINAHARQVDNLRYTLLAVRARHLDARKVHVGAHVHAERIADTVHNLFNAVATRACAQIEIARTHDDARFRRQARVLHRRIEVRFNVVHV